MAGTLTIDRKMHHSWSERRPSDFQIDAPERGHQTGDEPEKTSHHARFACDLCGGRGVDRRRL
jgi:hypothetical protein